jgi:hypothetical protein
VLSSLVTKTVNYGFVSSKGSSFRSPSSGILGKEKKNPRNHPASSLSVLTHHYMKQFTAITVEGGESGDKKGPELF